MRRRFASGWAVLVAAIALPLMAVPGSYALWSAAVPTAAGTVQAANFRVLLTDSAGAATELPATAALTVVGAPEGMLPGSVVTAELRITNDGNARSEAAKVTVGVNTLPYAVESDDPDGARAFARNLTMRMARNVPQATACSAATGYANIAMSSTGKAGEAMANPIQVTLDKGATTKWCVQLQLAADTPAAAQGQDAVVTIPLRVDQVPA